MSSKTYAATASQRVAFLGLGTMGYPMAGHLAQAGHQVTVYNRTAAKADAWCTEYAACKLMHTPRPVSTPRQAATGAELVFCCVGNDDDLRAVVLGADGAFAGMSAGTVLVDHSTTSAEVARELHSQALSLGLHFIDAPVSGGQLGAQQGVLTVMCGGDRPAFDAACATIMCYAKAITYLGHSGAGQLAKMVNQICVASVIQGLAEAIAFGQQVGLDMNQVLDIISQGAAQSWQMEQRGKTMVADQFDFGFAVDWMRKDLSLLLDQARCCGAKLPVTALIDQFYADVQGMGGGRWDTSSLIKRLK